MKLELVPHPDHPPAAIRSVTATLSLTHAGWLTLRWKVDGAIGLVIPILAGKGRADDLWQTTCFELFVKKHGGAGYAEFNLSPSERWAAYDFSDYRENRIDRPVSRQPDCTIRKGTAVTLFDAAIPLSALPPLPWRAGINAVLEEQGGTKSYWALAHPPGKPDFHDPACFAAVIPAPAAG